MSQQNNNRTIREINLSEISIPDFQRKVDVARAKKIAADFDIRKFDVPVIYQSGCGYGVIDGNHRITAARMLGIKKCECAIVQANNADAAKLFYTQNANKRSISPLDAFAAKLIAQEADAISMNQAVNAAGFIITNNPEGAKNICAVAALQRICQTYSPQDLTDVLNLISNAWPNDEKARRGDMLRGIARFADMCKKQGLWNKTEIIKKLSSVSVTQVLQSAGARTINYGDRYVSIAEVLVEVYNRKRKASSRLELTR